MKIGRCRLAAAKAEKDRDCSLKTRESLVLRPRRGCGGVGIAPCRGEGLKQASLSLTITWKTYQLPGLGNGPVHYVAASLLETVWKIGERYP